MDTTEQYIKQSDCEEIQGQRAEGVYEPGDYSWDGYGITYHPTHSVARSAKRQIRLPGQDELQGMLKLPLLDLLCGFRDFIEFDKNPSYAALFTSMEQLWLAFVMKEKFNKTWDGDKWVK